MASLNTGATKKVTHIDINEKLINLYGDKFRKYRQAWNEAGPSSIPDFPVHIDFELVDECNIRCGFCARNKKTHPNLPYEVNTRAELADDVIGKIIESASLHGLYSINVAWGEPLLYKNVFKVIKKFHDSGVMDSRLITNGLLLNKFTDQIFESGLINLYVSLDAFSEETYVLQRGRGYQKVVDNFLVFLKEKKRRKSFLPVTRVSFIKTNENVHEMEAFKDFWEDKVDIIDVQILTDFNKNEYGNPENKKWNCIEPFRRLSIIGNGDIIPCCAFPGKNLVVGNIHNMTIKEAWDSDKLKLIRENLLKDKEPVCLACQGC